jgi:uncharacterized membrane protein HdeD (DUF308 family)
MTEDEIVEAFQRNRQIANTRGWPVFGAGVVIFGAGILSFALPTARWVGLIALFGGMLLMIAGITTVAERMRCPACNRAVRDGRGRILVNPSSCPKCGVRLR